MISRRHFLHHTFAASLLSALAHGQDKKPRRIVLRSSWQTVNIGDIAHTPGVLALLEKHLPEVEVRLWPSKVDNGVEEMLTRRFPALKIIKTPDDIRQAYAECDFLLHGSGPSLVAEKDVVRWSEATGKPYGVYGITLPITPSTATNAIPDAVIAKTIAVLSAAQFVYFRDSVSLQVARDRGCTSPLMEFCPEGSFAVDLRHDAAANAFLAAHALEKGQFLCCIPRLRYTPYWSMKPGVAFDEKKHALNEQMKEHDLGPLRASIVAVARQSPMKVLVCPEDSSQMAIGKEMLVDQLPDDVKAKVAWRPDYWLTDEAVSTYARSAGLFGAEMHSPIMCIGQGIPAIVCRWKEQTSKGLMWRDIGLGEWLFNMDEESEIPGIVPAVLALAQDPAGAKAKAMKAREFVQQRQRDSMAVIGKALAAAK